MLYRDLDFGFAVSYLSEYWFRHFAKEKNEIFFSSFIHFCFAKQLNIGKRKTIEVPPYHDTYTSPQPVSTTQRNIINIIFFFTIYVIQ